MTQWRPHRPRESGGPLPKGARARGPRVVVNGRHQECVETAAREIARASGARVEAVAADLGDAEGCSR